MDKPLVSVLTTVYNREKHLKDCITSVLLSTYTNWEMIIVDDRSSDNSVEIANTFAKQDARIKVYINESNLGDYYNRNRAAEYANGKYIKYLDADDIIYPHGLEIFVTTMENFPEAPLGISQEVYEDFLPYPFILNPKETFEREFLKRGVLGAPPTFTIIKREAFEELGKFSGTRYSGDTEMWLKIALQYPIVKLVPGLAYWRRHEGQEFSLGMESNDYLILNYQLKNKMINHPDCPLSSTQKQLAIKRINYRHSRNLINLALIKKKPVRAYEIFKETNFSFLEILKSLRKIKEK